MMQHHEPECYVKKKLFAVFKVKVTVRAHMIKIWLSADSSDLNLVWWYIIISQSVLWKNWITAFKVKVTAKDQNAIQLHLALTSDDVHERFTLLQLAMLFVPLWCQLISALVDILCWGPLKDITGLLSLIWPWHSVIWHWSNTGCYARKYSLCKYTDKIGWMTEQQMS